jgi:hypothetical protein
MKLCRLLNIIPALFLVVQLSMLGGCATIRVTDPPRTADEEFLENVATAMAVDQISTSVLRDRKVYVETTYLTASTQPSDEHQYLLGELRSKLLLSGVRVVSRQQDAQIIMEVRSQGISNDRIEFLLGLPSTSLGGIFTGGLAAVTPELAIVKTTKQYGFASIAYIAYWADSGEVVASSGPFVGRTNRDDFWLFGFGPRTTGNIPPAEPPPLEGSSSSHASDPSPAKKAASAQNLPAKGPFAENPARK